MVRGLAPPTRPSPRESRSGRVRGRTPGHGASSDPRIALRLRQTPRQPSASGAVRRRRRGAMGGLDGPFRLVSTCSLDGHPLSDISSSRLGERCSGPTRCPALPTRTGSRAGRPKAVAIRSPEGQSLRPTASSRTRWRGMVATRERTPPPRRRGSPSSFPAARAAGRARGGDPDVFRRTDLRARFRLAARAPPLGETRSDPCSLPERMSASEPIVLSRAPPDGGSVARDLQGCLLLSRGRVRSSSSSLPQRFTWGRDSMS